MNVKTNSTHMTVYREAQYTRELTVEEKHIFDCRGTLTHKGLFVRQIIGVFG